MDGVLLDSEPIYVENNARIYRQLGIDVPMEEQMSYVGIDPEHMWNSIIKNYSLSDSVDELIEIEKKAQFEIFNEKDLSPVEGIEEFLDQLEQLNIPVAVAS